MDRLLGLYLAYGVAVAAVVLAFGVYRRYLRGRIVRHVVPIATAVLLLGEVWNGVWRAPGFSWPLFLVGVAVFAAAWVPRLSRTMSARLSAAAAGAWAAIQEDFGQPALPPATHIPWRRVAALVMGCVVVYIGYSHLLLLRSHPTTDFDYLRELTGLRSHVSWWALATLDGVTVPGSTHHPYTFLLYPLLGTDLSQNVWIQLRLSVFTTALIVLATGLAEVRRLGALSLFGSALLFFIFTVPHVSLWASEHMNAFFTLLFFINLVLILRLRFTTRYVVAVGLLTGFAFAQKQVNIINIGLVLWLLWEQRERAATTRRLLWAFLLAVGVGALPMFCLMAFGGQASDGVYLLPMLSLRGYTLRYEVGQVLAKSLIGSELSLSPLALASRVSFQTVGEIVVGALPLAALALTVLPLPYVAARSTADQRARILRFLALAALFYGFSFWKRGNSASPLYSVIALGLPFVAPYLWSLGRNVVRHVRERRPARRWWYLGVLLVLNVSLYAASAVAVGQELLRARHLHWGTDGKVVSTYPFSPAEKRLVAAVEAIPRDEDGHVPLSLSRCTGLALAPPAALLAHVDAPLALFILEHNQDYLGMLLEGDEARLPLILASYRLLPPPGQAAVVLDCLDGDRAVRLKRALADPASLVARCLRVTHDGSADVRAVLYVLDATGCAPRGTPAPFHLFGADP